MKLMFRFAGGVLFLGALSVALMGLWWTWHGLGWRGLLIALFFGLLAAYFRLVALTGQWRYRDPYLDGEEANL